MIVLDTILIFQGIPIVSVYGSTAEKKSFRIARKMIWAWFIDVTIFRVLCRHNIFLHGTVKQPSLDIEKMTDTAEGHAFAAKRFARHFADSPVTSGSGFLGFGRYAYALATTNGNNATYLPSALEVRAPRACMHIVFLTYLLRTFRIICDCSIVPTQADAVSLL